MASMEDNSVHGGEQPPFKVIFLGTGVSTAMPNIRHVLDFNDNLDTESQSKVCRVCQHAMSIPHSKNKRNNVSIAVQFKDKTTGDMRCVMVDAGKTMRDACIAQFPRHGITSIHGLLLTHGHADAILGLDDIRDLQVAQRVETPDPHNPGTVAHGFRIISGKDIIVDI